MLHGVWIPFLLLSPNKSVRHKTPSMSKYLFFGIEIKLAELLQTFIFFVSILEFLIDAVQSWRKERAKAWVRIKYRGYWDKGFSISVPTNLLRCCFMFKNKS